MKLEERKNVKNKEKGKVVLLQKNKNVTQLSFVDPFIEPSIQAKLCWR